MPGYSRYAHSFEAASYMEFMVQEELGHEDEAYIKLQKVRALYMDADHGIDYINEIKYIEKLMVQCLVNSFKGKPNELTIGDLQMMNHLYKAIKTTEREIKEKQQTI